MVIQTDAEGTKILNELVDVYLKVKGLAGQRLVDVLVAGLVELPTEGVKEMPKMQIKKNDNKETDKK